MPVFNFGGTIKNTAAQDYGFLVDQLDIKKNQLASDGKLSPGDYNLLISDAQKLFAHPALTPAQRSNVLVKISQYQQEQRNSTQKDLNDLTKLSNEVKDTYATNVMTASNNPVAFLSAKRDTLAAKLLQLKDSIDQLDSSGADSSAHLNEYLGTLTDYNDTIQALDDVNKYSTTPTGKPNTGFAAYITTNTRGQITDLKIDRVGSNSGYSEVKALYGGLPVYANTKGLPRQNGDIIFRLGDQTYSGADVVIPDPNNPGSFKGPTLFSGSQKKPLGPGFTSTNQAIPYENVDLTKVIPQSYVSDGGWAQGSSGNFYQKNSDGTYTKYIGTTKDKLRINDSQIINIPRSIEQGILGSTTKTIPSDNFTIPQPTSSVPLAPQISSPAALSPLIPSSTPTPTQPGQNQEGTSRTPSPVTRSPIGATGIAEQALSFGKGILNSLFNRGQ